jgi:hypothetical protein
MTPLFVYICNCGKRYVIEAGEPIVCPKCYGKDREHVSTIEPKIIIQRVLDGEQVLNTLMGVP